MKAKALSLTFLKNCDPSRLGNGPMSNSLLANGAAGTPSDIDGQAKRPNGAFGKSDIEGKAAIGSGERAGEANEFQTSRSE
jgi:hypothetical protein